MSREGGKDINHPHSHSHAQGQGLVEYALIIALVAIIVIAILVIMGPQEQGRFGPVLFCFLGIVGVR